MLEYQEFCRLFALAECKVKQLENTIDKLPIPSINELRYAGFHSVCSLKIGISDETKQKEIQSAINHCKRAIHDAMEIGILYYLREIREFEKDYKFVSITSVLPSYIQDTITINEIRGFIDKLNRHDENRMNHWEKFFNKNIY